MNPDEALLVFFDAINRHDPDALAALMTEDHVFIDSLAASVRGREKMRAGWRAYFAMCPDYKVSQADIFHSGNIVAAFGSAGGTIREIRWQTPAAWRVVVLNGLIQEFRVYADNKPVYEILAKWSQPAPKQTAPGTGSPVSELFQRNNWHRKAALREPPRRALSGPFDCLAFRYVCISPSSCCSLV